MSELQRNWKIAVVIPCYQVERELPAVVSAIPDSISNIYCVDDCCPNDSTRSIEGMKEHDPRIVVLRREENGGVGAAVVTGYRKAVEDGADIVIKIDGDGQMDPALIPLFSAEIAEGRADYVKGNRFYSLDVVRSMPFVRKIGNMGLSFMTKLSTGYWRVFDPTNGYTAIHANLVRALPLDKVEKRYFFESDMLFHVGLLRACVVDVPMRAVYGEEESNLSNVHALFSFPLKHFGNLLKRLFYNYYLRNFSLASIELILGVAMVLFGVIFGMGAWMESVQTGTPATAGTVMLASLPTLLGMQFILNFFALDIASEPDRPIHERLESIVSLNDGG